MNDTLQLKTEELPAGGNGHAGMNEAAAPEWPDWLAYEPDLVPPPEMMWQEAIGNIEEWFRWAEEWSMLLRVYGKLGGDSRVLEIGCGLGRVAFALRHLLSEKGSYDGFEICRFKVEFLERFHQAYPSFRFHWADLRNTHYNPEGELLSTEYSFPVDDDSMDIVYAASVFTHLLPPNTEHYFRESARVLKPGGRCVFSFFLMENYRLGNRRPYVFSRPDFEFQHTYAAYGDDFHVAFPDDPERTAAYSFGLIQRLAGEAGLDVLHDPVPGIWSGGFRSPVSTQDIVVLRKP